MLSFAKKLDMILYMSTYALFISQRYFKAIYKDFRAIFNNNRSKRAHIVQKKHENINSDDAVWKQLTNDRYT